MTIEWKPGMRGVRRDGVGPCEVLHVNSSTELMEVRHPDRIRMHWLSGRIEKFIDRSRDLISEYIDPPALLTEFPINRALVAKVPTPEPRQWVRWVAIRRYHDGAEAACIGIRHKVVDDPSDLIGMVRVVITEGQFDEPQPGDPL